jgi:mycofactocin precursor
MTEPAKAGREGALRGAALAGPVGLGGHDSRGDGGWAGLPSGGGAPALPRQEALAHIGDDHEDDDLVPDDLLVEEISIDGMCGVY